MNKFSLIILGAWIVLAILDFISAFKHIPVVGFIFGALNIVIIFNLIPLLIQELKAKKAEKRVEEVKPQAEEIVVEEPKRKRTRKTQEEK